MIFQRGFKAIGMAFRTKVWRDRVEMSSKYDTEKQDAQNPKHSRKAKDRLRKSEQKIKQKQKTGMQYPAFRMLCYLMF